MTENIGKMEEILLLLEDMQERISELEDRIDELEGRIEERDDEENKSVMDRLIMLQGYQGYSGVTATISTSTTVGGNTTTTVSPSQIRRTSILM